MHRPPVSTTRYLLALLAVSACLAGIMGLFWWQDWRYSQPTPRPASLFQPTLGTHLVLNPLLRPYARPGHALLLHFFNADCPCSRFNIEHLRALKQRFAPQGVDFLAVLFNRSERSRRAFEQYHLGIPAISDENHQLARDLGVYSTPQAVLLTSRQELYFRGNYNLSRFCIDSRTEFVRLALERLVAGQSLGPQPPAALIAYGCPLNRRTGQ